MFNKNKVLMFRIVYTVYYIAQALSYCLLINYLTGVGYSATDRSIFFSCAAVAGIFINFFVGYLCDKNKTIKKYVMATFLLYGVGTLLVYSFSQKVFFVHFLLVMIVSSMMSVTMGLLDTWCLVSSDECKNHFGSIRVMGSIGYAIGSELAAMVFGWFNYVGVGVVTVITLCIAIALFFREQDFATENKKQPINFKDISKLFGHKGYVLAVFTLFSLFIAISAQSLFVIDKMNLIGATEAHISRYYSISAILELPLFLLGDKIVQKAGLTSTALFVVVAYAVKFVLFGLVGTPNAMIVVSMLQFCTFPLLSIVSKQLIDKESPENMKMSGQQIALAIYSGFAGLIAPLIEGIIEDGFGINTTIYIFAGVTILSTLMLLTYIGTKKKEANA